MKIYLFCIFGIFSVLLSCQQVDEWVNGDRVKKKRIVSDSVVENENETGKENYEFTKPNFTVDSIYTNKARFLSGLNVTGNLSGLQKKSFYQQYVKQIEEDWTKVEKENLLHIKLWIKEKQITNVYDDTLTLFYPFSGPDFLYANSFFPYCNNYIMLGLENLGTLPDFASMSDSAVSKYLNDINYSLRYINKMGYFVTSQMQNDFNKHDLDGVIHVIMFYLARLKYEIVSATPVYINSFGKATPQEVGKTYSKELTGWKIEFWDQKSEIIKNIYYLKIDLKNENLKNQPDFYTFLSRFDEKITYIKSGSYILHNDGFSIMRKLVEKQSVKILQDDTGIPYYILKADKFNIKLYGNYSKTIGDFAYMFQNDLYRDLMKVEEKERFLPFKIGYNAWYNETVLIFARTQSQVSNTVYVPDTTTVSKVVVVNENTNENKENTKVDENLTTKNVGVVFRVQIKSSVKKIANDSPVFQGLTPVHHYIGADGGYKYTFGSTTTLNDCLQLQKLAKSKGFNDAFVVAFSDDKRITIEEAKKLLK